ncbi:MAG: nitroreductase family deazaflavin-dependent oxidoreductase [Anaerolineae bacterium]|nr:nitroreductase family deazaflavin-dependent oxidoreductase [Anaerolineae bacterium]
MTSEAQYLYLTTIGHKTGKAHEIEIWFVPHEGCYYLVSERFEQSHWVQNIAATPAIRWRVGSRNAPEILGQGRQVDAGQEPELAAAVCALMDTKYGWSEGLIVELCPG